MLLFLQAKLGEPSEQAQAVRRMLATGWSVSSLSPAFEPEAWALSLRAPEGSACTVRLSRAELAVSADFAHTLGHPDAARLSKPENTP